MWDAYVQFVNNPSSGVNVLTAFLFIFGATFFYIARKK